jgi:hypothetical protein
MSAVMRVLLTSTTDTALNLKSPRTHTAKRTPS